MPFFKSLLIPGLSGLSKHGTEKKIRTLYIYTYIHTHTHAIQIHLHMNHDRRVFGCVGVMFLG